MNKVYSLDTYRELVKTVSKKDAIFSSEIDSQEKLELHYKNIEIIKNNKELDRQMKFEKSNGVS